MVSDLILCGHHIACWVPFFCSINQKWIFGLVFVSFSWPNYLPPRDPSVVLIYFFVIFFHHLYPPHEPYSWQRKLFMLAILPSICHLHFWLEWFCFVVVILFGKSAVHRSFAVADNLGEVSAKAQVRLQHLPFCHCLLFCKKKFSWFRLVLLSDSISVLW